MRDGLRNLHGKLRLGRRLERLILPEAHGARYEVENEECRDRQEATVKRDLARKTATLADILLRVHSREI